VADTNWNWLIINDSWNTDPKWKWNLFLNHLKLIKVSFVFTRISDQEDQSSSITCLAINRLDNVPFKKFDIIVCVMNLLSFGKSKK